MRKLINLLLLSCLSVFFVSCGDSTTPDSDEFVIKGKLLNSKSEILFLDELLVNKTQTIDSTIINEDGEFFFKELIKEPGFYLLRIKDRNHITLLIKPEDLIEINGDALKLEKTYSVKGSEDSKKIQQLYVHYYVNMMRVDSLRNVYLASQVRSDFEQITGAIDTAYLQIFADQQRYVQKFIEQNKSSLISILAMYQTFGQKKVLTTDDELKYSEMVDRELFKQFPRNKHVAYLHQRLTEMKRIYTEQTLTENRLKIGSIAPDFTMQTIKNDTFKLSSLRGKTVLLNFWSPRCEECLAQNYRLKVRYEKYNPVGFDIVNVAIEDDKAYWENAVKKIDMPWHQCNDMQGMTSPILTLYNLSNNFPYNFIIDPQGRIISKGLQSDSLYVKLRSLFAKDTAKLSK